MNDKFVGQVAAWRGEDEYIEPTEVLCEVIEIQGDQAEIAFNLPVRNGPCIYLRISIQDVLALMLRERG